MSKKDVKYLVVGGGVSGLMFANQVKDQDFLIIEKESELGGYCRTIYQDGFIWDYAGHFFHFANQKIKDFFEKKVPANELVQKVKCTKIFYKNLLIDFPFQANIHQLNKEEFIECLYDLYFREESPEYGSFLEMLYGKFGTSITNKFLRPYNEKLYACDLNALDVDAMGRFFPYASLDQIVKGFKQEYQGSYNSTFLYPKKGARVFVDALASDIPKSKISLSEILISIDIKNKVATTNLRDVSYEYLINSSPLTSLCEYLDVQELEGFGSRLSWNKVLVFNMGFDGGAIQSDLHWAYFPEKKYNFYRVGFYNNILDDSRLSLYVEIGLASDSIVDTESELATALEGLRAAGIINEHKLVSYSSIMMDPAYVHVDSSLSQDKDVVKRKLEEGGIYTIGRYGDWKYCSIEDSMLDAIDVAERIS